MSSLSNIKSCNGLVAYRATHHNSLCGSTSLVRIARFFPTISITLINNFLKNEIVE